ncbi:MAG: hypothetical protein LBG61_00300 [Burkholderiales bacterium]|jgi:hypothetical protein|nr:hypothetical protein [Burkholderiales bacterium]
MNNNMNRFIVRVAAVLFALIGIGSALAQETPCAISPAADASLRKSIQALVQRHDSLSMGFEEDGCARVGQAIEILNRTLKGDYFKAAQAFDFFMLTDESEDFNTFMIVRLIFGDEASSDRLEAVYKEKMPKRAASEAPLMLEAAFKDKTFTVLFSPPKYFNKNREIFYAVQKSKTP